MTQSVGNLRDAQAVVQGNGQRHEGVQVPGFLLKQEQTLGQPLQVHSLKHWLISPGVHSQNPELHREICYEAVSLAEG